LPTGIYSACDKIFAKFAGKFPDIAQADQLDPFLKFGKAFLIKNSLVIRIS